MNRLLTVIRWIIRQPLNRGNKQKALKRFLPMAAKCPYKSLSNNFTLGKWGEVDRKTRNDWGYRKFVCRSA